MNERQNDPEQALSDEARQDRQVAEREVAEKRQAQTARDPHHELSNPVEDPDPTEFPDPYEKRPDTEGDGPSTSEPPPPRNLDRLRDGEGTEQ
jgi:hypothetical protein